MKYVIKLIAPNGNRGYVYDSPDRGVLIITNGYDPNISMWDSMQEARVFVKERKLEKKGIRAFVRTTIEMGEDKEFGWKLQVMSSDTTGEMYYLENEDGQKMFHDTQKDCYFFRKQDIGFCVYYENQLDDLRKEVESMEIDMNMKISIKKISELPKK